MKNAYECLKKLVLEFKRGVGIFGEVFRAITDFPKANEKELANFLLFFVSIDYGMDARRLLERVRALFYEDRRYFDPFFLYKLPLKELRKVMREKIKHRFPSASAERWKEIAKQLIERYEGDASSMLKGDALECWNKLIEFKGIGRKFAGVYINFAIRAGIAELKNVRQVPVPVDIHLRKIAERIGLVEKGARVEQVSKAWNEAAERIRESWLDLNDALWIVGSELCRKRKCGQCVLKRICSASASNR